MKDWQAAGLVAPSLIRARLSTLHKDVIIRRLGRMADNDMVRVNHSLSTALNLGPGA